MAIPYSSTYKPSPYLEMANYQNPGSQLINQTRGAFSTPITDAGNAPFQMNSLKQGSNYGDYSSGMFDGAGNTDGGKGIFGNLMDSDFMKGMLGGKDKDGMGSNGWGPLALGAANTFMNMKNYGWAKDNFDFQKNLGTNNFNNQAALTQDHLNKLYARDVIEAKMNGRAAPAAAPVLTRMG